MRVDRTGAASSWRFWRRRYNRSAELARRLAADWNLATSQGAMARAKARRGNVLGGFPGAGPGQSGGRADSAAG